MFTDYIKQKIANDETVLIVSTDKRLYIEYPKARLGYGGYIPVDSKEQMKYCKEHKVRTILLDKNK